MKPHNEDNPFLISGYKSPEYFCDREEETSRIIAALKNGRNLTIISLRRIGKTGLIHNTFHELTDDKKLRTVYIDAYPIKSTAEFVEMFATAIMKSMEPERDKLINRVLRLFANLRPVISFDSLTAQPNLELKISEPGTEKHTLEQIFDFIKKESFHFIIAIDEFQQLVEFEEGRLVAIIRTLAQTHPNINFIFSGSKKHVLMNIFSSPKGIFYRSAGVLSLEPINDEMYSEFIRKKFRHKNININDEALERLFLLSRGHTFYVQYLCNRVYAKPVPDTKYINFELVNNTFIEILNENEPVFLNYLNLLPVNQKALLKAIASEGKINEPTSHDFIRNHKLTAASSVRQALNALLSKEMIYEENGYYFVYDVFFSEWLKRR